MQRPHDRGMPGLFEKQQEAARTREGAWGDSQRDEPNHEGLRRPRDPAVGVKPLQGLTSYKFKGSQEILRRQGQKL